MALEELYERDLSPVEKTTSPDDESHIRGVKTAMKPAEVETFEEPQGGKVISLFRVETFQNVGEALFSETELQRYAKGGERERSIKSLLGQLQLSFPYRLKTLSETYGAYKEHIAAIIQKITVANDIGNVEYSDEVERDAENFLLRNLPGSPSYDVQLRDLHKVFYLLQASQNVAARMGF